MKTPILFLLFNRLDTALQVFERIRQQRPEQLFVAADAPRPEVPGEAEKCAAVRAIIKKIDWPCSLHTRFLDQHLGCKLGVSSAVDWFFSQVEEGIILEDDCLPDPTFFPFCETLLEYYRDDIRIMHIGGGNFQFDRPRSHQYSYYFSQISHIWGWASWRRAWQYYDVNCRSFFIPENEPRLYADPYIDQNVKKMLEEACSGSLDTWDVQWQYAVISRNGLAILPDSNLICNLGFAPDALHTTDVNSCYSRMKTIPMSFPLKHPPLVCPNYTADSYTYRLNMPPPRWLAQFHYYRKRIWRLLCFK